MTEYSKEQKLKMQLQQCHGFDGDEIANAREQALDYYFMRKRGDEVVGRSDVVSGDVSAMVDATLAQMVDAFSSDRICDFDPLGPEDEDQAQLESDAVQYFVMGKENGFLELVMAIKEILLLRNGVMMVDAQERKERITRKKRNVSLEAFAELIDDESVVSHKYSEETGDLSITYERTTLEFVTESVPLENFLYYKLWHKPTLKGIPVCAVRHITTRAELIKLGMPKALVNELTAHKHDLKTESMARNPRQQSDNAVTPYDKSQDLIEWYHVYVMAEAGDADELRKITFSFIDAVILEDVPCPFINLAAGCAIINPHRFTGISLFDKLKQTQDNRTALRRALHDNVNATSKNRLAGFEGMVNEDDHADGRVTKMVRVKPMLPRIGDAVMALQVPDTSANILANLESTARERAEMGGAALDLQTAQLQIGGDRMGSQGLDRAYSVSEQLTASMMKTVAATLIRSLFLVAHAVLREYFDQPVPIKRNGKWTHVVPSEWPERESCTVKPGMSPGERTRRVNALTEVIDSHLILSERGLDEVLVDIDGFNKALLDRARLNEVQNPEQYYVDPASDRAQAALQSKAKQRQAEKMQKAMLMQQAFGMEQLGKALEKFRHETELQFKYFSETLRAEIEEAKIVGSVGADLIKQQRAGRERAGEETGSDGAAGEQAASRDTQAAEE